MQDLKFNDTDGPSHDKEAPSDSGASENQAAKVTLLAEQVIAFLTGDLPNNITERQRWFIMIARAVVFISLVVPLSFGFAEKNSDAFNETMAALDATIAIGNPNQTISTWFFPWPSIEGRIASLIPNCLLNGESTRLWFIQWCIEHYITKATSPLAADKGKNTLSWYGKLVIDISISPCVALPTLLYSRALFKEVDESVFSLALCVVYLQTIARFSQLHYGSSDLPNRLRKFKDMIAEKNVALKSIYWIGACISFLVVGLMGFANATFIPSYNHTGVTNLTTAQIFEMGEPVTDNNWIDALCEDIASLSLTNPALYGSIKATSGIMYSITFSTYALIGVALCLSELGAFFQGRGFFLTALAFSAESAFSNIDDLLTADSAPSKNPLDTFIPQVVMSMIEFGLTLLINFKSTLMVCLFTYAAFQSMINLLHKQYCVTEKDNIDEGQSGNENLLIADNSDEMQEINNLDISYDSLLDSIVDTQPAKMNTLAWLLTNIVLSNVSPVFMLAALAQFLIAAAATCKITTVAPNFSLAKSKHRLTVLPGQNKADQSIEVLPGVQPS